MDKFQLVSEYKPTGDQPKAIQKLVEGIEKGFREQTLLGVTGSGKTYTMANVIEKIGKPTLVLAHNKTLAAQLCSEFKEFFPNNSVEYFVSYYDYYQPEAYVASTDTYIEKDSAINDEIEKLRHSATNSIAERKDLIVVASVSCIYSLGNPIDYKNMVISLREGMEKNRDELIKKLIDIQYERNDINFQKNKFRVRGDVLEIYPPYSKGQVIRVDFFGDEIEKISEINPLTGEVLQGVSHVAIYPASHYIFEREKINIAIKEIEDELSNRIKYFEDNEMLLEAQRIKQRTMYDLEMLLEIGFCKGVENYSRVLSGRPEGSVPYSLIDHFPEDFLMIIDESHVMLPQIRGMFGGDYARKKMLVDYGFRLPSAFDNRPLNFDEFYKKINQAVYVSATPSDFEKEHSSQIVQQVIRPTGLLDPTIDVKLIEGQIEDILYQINERIKKDERVFITTLTKKMSEDLTNFLLDHGIKVKYIHCDIDTMERMEILRDLRLGKFDVLIGINLLREGIDVPEVSLVCILDADKQGFLRSESALIQTIGRAARNSNGHVIMYADIVTNAMEKAITETQRRREIQIKYNIENDITPTTIKKDIRDIIEISKKNKKTKQDVSKMSIEEKQKLIITLKKDMKEAARLLEFEHAAFLRDRLKEVEHS